MGARKETVSLLLALAEAQGITVEELVAAATSQTSAKDVPTVRAYLPKVEVAASPKEIAAGTGLDYDAVRQLLRQMTHDKQLISPERGKYLIPGQENERTQS